MMWYIYTVEYYLAIKKEWTYLQNRNRLTDLEIRIVVAKAGGGGKGWTGSLGLVDTNYYI